MDVIWPGMSFLQTMLESGPQHLEIARQPPGCWTDPEKPRANVCQRESYRHEQRILDCGRNRRFPHPAQPHLPPLVSVL